MCETQIKLNFVNFYFTGGQGASTQSSEDRQGGDHSRSDQTVGPKETVGCGRGEKLWACTSEGQEEVRRKKGKAKKMEVSQRKEQLEWFEVW